MKTSRRSLENMKRATLGLAVAALLGLAGAPGALLAQSWVPAGGGTWNDINSWSTLSLPDSDTAQIVFTKNYAAAPTFTLDRAAPFTVNKITYNDNTTAFYSGAITPGSPAGSLIFAGATPTIDTPAATANAADLTITAPVDVTLGLTKTGARSAFLNGAVTGIGPLVYNTVNAGLLAIGSATPMDWTAINKTTGNGTLRLDALTTMTAPATFSVSSGELFLNPASGPFSFNAAGFTKSGTGTLRFGKAATGPGGSAVLIVSGGYLALSDTISNFTSGTVSNGATLQANAALTYGNIPLTIIGAGASGSQGALHFRSGGNTTVTWPGAITLGSGGASIGSYGVTYNTTLSGAISGTGPLVLQGQGGSDASHTSTFTLTANSTYNGDTTFKNNAGLSEARLKLGVNNALPVTTALTLSMVNNNPPVGVTLDLNGKSQQLAGLAKNASGASTKYRILNSSATASTLIVSNDTACAFDGLIGITANANLSLIKQGNATLTLSGTNTYTGLTTINEGTLQIGSGGTAGTLGSGVVSNLATLVFNRSDTVTLTNSVEGSGMIVVSSGTLKLSPMPVPVALVNAGFELPVYGVGLWAYLTSDGVTGGWTFNTAGGGIARSGSTWVGTAPEGLQAAFLQASSYMAQNINLPSAASYRLSFAMVNRPAKNAGDLALVIDGVTNKTWTAAEINNSGVFRSFSVDLGEMTAGAHVLKFEGWSSDATDRATDIDNVQLSQVSGARPGPISSSAQVSLSSSATTLELDGANQTLAGLSGSGLVTNSAVTAATLTIGSTSSTFFGGVIGGNIALTKTGSGTWTLGGSSTYSGATQIEGGTLQLAPALGAVTVDNASFETHGTLVNGTWGYAPDGATWIFSAGNSGISTANGTWIATGTTLDGTKAGFIQRIGTLSNTVSVAEAGWYTISFLAGKRPGFPATQLFVEVDGATQFQFAPAAFVDAGGIFRGTAFLSSGAHTLAFRGYSTADAATWIDQVQIASVGGKLPAGTPAALAEGTTLDLGGNTQALAGLSGSGLVTNGTLSVTGTIAPGGESVRGTLTIPGGATLNSTLLIDVATDGSCDVLQVQGSLDVSNLALQIQDLGLLGTGKQYVIARCAPGGLNGRFLSTNLGNIKAIQYNNAAGEVRLVGRGTMIRIY